MGQSTKHLRPATKLRDHIRELAMRLLVSFFALVIAGVVVYMFYGPILEFLRSPLGTPLYYSNPAGSFAFIMKICFMGGLTITIPVLVFNLIMFIRPAFGQTLPIKRVYLTSILSSILAITGAAFAFFVILPGSLQFFAGFQVSGLNALISADSYLGFVTNIIITFVIVFQLPLLITFIDVIKPLPPKKLISMEKWVIMGSLAVALLAPFTYDLVTSLLIALPIVVLYNLSIVIVVVRHARIARKTRGTIHSTVVKPVIAPELAVNDLVLEKITKELTNFEKPPTKVVAEHINPHQIQEIQRVRPIPVQPPAWVVERNLKQAAIYEQKRAAIYEQVRALSKNNRNSGVNRVLA